MIRRFFIPTGAVITLLFSACATTPDAPTLREPAVPTQEAVAQFSEAEFHLLGGDLDAAQAIYEALLQTQPDSPHVMHQLAIVHLRRGEPQRTVDYARRAAGYATDLRPLLLTLEASALDRLGQVEASLAAFERALALAPDADVIHFNYGVTLLNRGFVDDAATHLRRAVGLDPLHANAHYALAEVYLRRSQRLPALLALLRALTLDGDSERAGQAASAVVELVERSVTVSADSSEKIVLSASKQRQEDGDFSEVELLLSLSQLGLQSDESANQARIDRVGHSLQIVFDGLGRKLSNTAPPDRPADDGFAWRYYAPFFAGIDAGERTEAFTVFALRAAELPGAREQLSTRRDEVSDYLRWQKDYVWPEQPAPL